MYGYYSRAGYSGVCTVYQIYTLSIWVIQQGWNLVYKIAEACVFWGEEALDTPQRGCLDLTSAQKWWNVIFQISAEKCFWAWQNKSPALFEWLDVLPHDFCTLQPTVIQSCAGPFLLSQETWKMTFHHFVVNVISKQPHVRASSASPAQKAQSLKRWEFHQICRQDFIPTGELRRLMYIWVICPWNKFGKKTQCEEAKEGWGAGRSFWPYPALKYVLCSFPRAEMYGPIA